MKFVVTLLLIDIIANFCYWRNVSGKLHRSRDDGGISQEQIDKLVQKLKPSNDALEERLNQPK